MCSENLSITLRVDKSVVLKGFQVKGRRSLLSHLLAKASKNNCNASMKRVSVGYKMGLNWRRNLFGEFTTDSSSSLIPYFAKVLLG